MKEATAILRLRSILRNLRAAAEAEDLGLVGRLDEEMRAFVVEHGDKLPDITSEDRKRLAKVTAENASRMAAVLDEFVERALRRAP